MPASAYRVGGYTRRSIVCRRRHILKLAVAGLLVLLAGGEASAAGRSLAQEFADPSPASQPRFTWWWPGPAVKDAELRAEVNEMAAAGFGGAQIFEARLGLPRTGNPPETDMWGTPHWAARIRAAMEAARRRGFRIDVNASSEWPWTSPAVGAGAQELAFGRVAVNGPAEYVKAPPAPVRSAPGARKLVAVTAARGGARLDPRSAVDLTSTVDGNGVVHWKVPPGKWVLFAFWQRGMTEARAKGAPPFVDYLRRESAEAAMKYLDDGLFDVLGRDLVAAVGDQFHEDSLDGGWPLFWTDDFLAEFRARRGYDLTRFLPALSFRVGQARPPAHDFTTTAGVRVRRDYNQTLTELWVDEHVRPVREWANRHGLESAGRATPGVIGLDVLAVAKEYDVPDIDQFNLPIDWVRTITSGARLSGARKASVEIADLENQDYMITPAALMAMVDKGFAGGANEIFPHGYPYKFAAGATWPSWWPYSSDHGPYGYLFDAPDPTIGAYGEGITSTLPLWRHLPRLAGYMARGQALLRVGRPVTDVAVYRDAYHFDPTEPIGDGPDFPEPALNSSLTRSGFGYDFVNPATLAERATRMAGGRLIVQRPGYKALVVELDASRRVGVVDNSDAMPVPAARRLLAFARAGLPIVFVGRFPRRSVSYRDPAREDAAVRRVVAALKRSRSVRLARDEAAVPGALAALGVRPDLALGRAARSSPGERHLSGPARARRAAPRRCGNGAPCVYSVHRRTARGDYWYVWNAGAEPARFRGAFAAGRRAPERWDLWSGERRPIGLYRSAGRRVEVPLSLGSGEATVIAFHRRARSHVVSTDAEEVVARDGRLFLRSTRGGVARARLSDGRRRTVDLGRLPSPVSPRTWDLHVDGAVPKGTERRDVRLTGLVDWRRIHALRNTSGTGTYRTTVTLPATGAYLELGRVEGGVQVRVNGRLVHPAVVPPPRIDLGPLRRGPNRIEIELTTTLKNRLTALGRRGVPGFARFPLRPIKTQPYGLLGPVRLIPYAERPIR